MPSKTEKKLMKVLLQSEALEAELQLMLPPKIFAGLLALAEFRLKQDRHGQTSRDEIARLAFQFRQEAYARFGHETLETFALGKLLKVQIGGFQPKQPRLDSISHMRNYKRKDDRLTSDQEEAAEQICDIWKAFGRFLQIGSRGMEGGGGRSRVIQPVEVMGEELWRHHKRIYVPWYNVAKTVPVDRKRGRGSISLAAIVFKILQDDMYPEQMDAAYGLRQGQALAALKAALDGYHHPDRLADYGKPPQTGNSTGKEASSSPKAASGGQG